MDIDYILPSFKREFFVYGKAELAEKYSLPDLNDLTLEGYLGSKKSLKIPKSLLSQNNKRFLQGLYPEVGRNFTARFIPVKTNAGVKMFVTGVYKGPLSRFNTFELGEGEAYMRGSGNPEIEKYLVYMVGRENLYLFEEIPFGIKAVVFDSYQRNALLNPSFCQVYDDYLLDGRDQIFAESINKNESEDIIVDRLKWVIQAEEIEQTILHQEWREKNQVPDKVFLDYFGGTVRFDFNDMKRVKRELDIVIHSPFKVLKKLWFYALKEAEYSFEPLCFYIGYKDED